MTRTSRGGIIAVLMVSAVGAPAAAQSTGSGTIVEKSADESAGDIVVTAQRRPQSLTQVPISVSVLQPATLERQAIVDTRQLVQISPALTFSEGSADRGGSFNIRGISSTAQEGGIQPSLSLVIDGVPVARQGEFIGNFLDVQQIEVLSGPQGTLFGKNATAGVINILTKEPSDRFETIGEASYTSDNEFVLRGTLNVPVNQSIRLRVNALYDDQSPIIKNIGIGGEIAGATTYAFAGKLAIDVTPTVTLKLQGDYRHRRSSYGPALILVPNSGALGDLQRRALGVPIGRGVDVTNQDADSFSRSQGWSAAAILDWQISDDWRITSVTAHRVYDFDNSNDIDAGPAGWTLENAFSPNPFNYPIGSFDRGLPRQPSNAHYNSQELRLNYSGKSLDIIVGGFYQNYKEHLKGSSAFFRNGFYIDGAVLDAVYHDRTAAIFADATYSIIDKIKVFSGVRLNVETVTGSYVRTPFQNALSLFDPVTGVNNAPPIARFAYDAGRTDHNLSGRVGLQYLPRPSQNYYLSFNRGFKGAAIDVSSGWATGSRIFADPEIASAFELGTRQTILNGKLFFTASVYHQIVENVQQSTVLPNSLTLAAQLQNAGDILSDGGEFQFDWKMNSALTLAGGLAYTHARYRGGVTACNVSQRAGLQTGCTIDANGDGVSESQSLTGHRAKETPEWSLNGSAAYEHDLMSHGKMFAQVSATFTDSIQYQLLNDPLTIEPSHWMVNAAIGYESPDDHWRITFFVKNLTNEFYYGNIGQTDGFIARSWGRVSRDAKRYAGLTVRAKW